MTDDDTRRHASELGKRGGEATKQKYGIEFLRENLRKAREAKALKYGKEHYQEIGRKGAASRNAKLTAEQRKEASRKGGETLAKKVKDDPDYFRKLGKKGREKQLRKNEDATE